MEPIHTIGLAGVYGSVATFRRVSVECAVEMYEAHYGHSPAAGWVIDDYALVPIIYMVISESDMEMHGVLAVNENAVVNT